VRSDVRGHVDKLTATASSVFRALGPGRTLRTGGPRRAEHSRASAGWLDDERLRAARLWACASRQHLRRVPHYMPDRVHVTAQPVNTAARVATRAGVRPVYAGSRTQRRHPGTSPPGAVTPAAAHATRARSTAVSSCSDLHYSGPARYQAWLRARSWGGRPSWAGCPGRLPRRIARARRGLV